MMLSCYGWFQNLLQPEVGTGKMVQQVEMLNTKPNGLSSIQEVAS